MQHYLTEIKQVAGINILFLNTKEHVGTEASIPRVNTDTT
jgi:hypothetical protein